MHRGTSACVCVCVCARAYKHVCTCTHRPIVGSMVIMWEYEIFILRELNRGAETGLDRTGYESLLAIRVRNNGLYLD